MRKSLIIVLSVIAGLMVLAICTLYFLINADTVSGYLSEELGSDFDVEIEEAALNPFMRSLTLKQAVISRPGQQAVTLFQAEHISLKGIGLFAAFRGELSAKAFILENFQINAQTRHVENEPEAGGDRLPVVSINSIQLSNGHIIISEGMEAKAEIHDFSLSAGPLEYRPDCTNCELWSHLKNIQVEIPNLHYSAWENRYLFRVEGLRISEPQSEISVARIYSDSGITDSEFYESINYRSEFFRFDLSELHIEQVGFKEFRDSGSVAASSFMLDSLDLHVTQDLRLPENPEKIPPAMPAELLQGLPFGLTLDTLEISYADIRYSEYGTESVRAGTVSFERTNALLTGIDNRHGDAVSFNARSYLQGDGELNIEMKIPLQADSLIAEVNGSLGSFNATLLNNIFLDLEGIEIREGHINSIQFDYIMMEEEAEGNIEIDYEELSVQVVDKDTHSQNFGNRLMSLFANEISLRASSSNNGEESRNGRVSEERDEEKSFFNYLWISIRSGLFDAIQRF